MVPASTVDAAPDEVDTYRTVVFCRLTGLSLRQVDYLDRNGILNPSVSRPRGSGTQRLYSGHDLAVGHALKRLRILGATNDACRVVVATLRELPVADWPPCTLIDHTGRFHTDLTCDGWFIHLRDDHPEGAVP